MEGTEVLIGGGDRCGIGHVRDPELTLHLGGDRLGPVTVAIEHHHGGAGLVQRPGDAGPDPRTSTCNDIATLHGRYL